MSDKMVSSQSGWLFLKFVSPPSYWFIYSILEIIVQTACGIFFFFKHTSCNYRTLIWLLIANCSLFSICGGQQYFSEFWLNIPHKWHFKIIKNKLEAYQQIATNSNFTMLWWLRLMSFDFPDNICISKKVTSNLCSKWIGGRVTTNSCQL